MDFASQNLTAGQLNAVVKKLGGEEGALRFLRGELEVVVKATIAFVFALWKTLVVGTHKSVADIRTALSAAGMRLGDYAADILGKAPLGVGEASSVEFVRVKVKDLGFTKQTSLRDILAEGQRRGLKLCLPEDGVAIRLGYPEQPMGEAVWLAMEPLRDSDGSWHVLCVNRYGFGLWLNTFCSSLGRVWSPECGFVFRK